MIKRSRVPIPAGAAGEFSYPGSTFCANSYFGIRSTRVTAVARKRSRSFCQKCGWQVTAKHACTQTPSTGLEEGAGQRCSECGMHLPYVALHEVTWCMVVRRTQNLRRDGNSFLWHQPRQRCKYTTSMDVQKRAIKS